MRIWGIDPRYLCIKHINGQHNEIHKHLPSLYKGVNIDGRFNPIVQIELWSLQWWHDRCAEFLNHKSLLEVDKELLRKNYPQYYSKRVDVRYNIKDLAGRCDKCRDKLIKGGLLKWDMK